MLPSSSSSSRPVPYAASLASQTTRASALNLPNPPPFIVTRADLRDSLAAYETLLASAKTFRLAMMNLSSATATFAAALEQCARIKGAQSWEGEMPRRAGTRGRGQSKGGTMALAGLDGNGEESSEDEGERTSAAERLLAASGLHFLTANHEGVLADTIYKFFEIPLLENFDAHRNALADRQASYDADLADRTRKIRETESRNLREGRRRVRDLGTFRKGLKELQGQVDEVERVKQEYYREVAESEHEVWEEVAEKISLVVRSEVELFDRVSSKGSSDATLETMLTAVPDPFDSYDSAHFGPGRSPVPGSASPGLDRSPDSPEIYTILTPLATSLTPAQELARRTIRGTGALSPPPSSRSPSREERPVEPAGEEDTTVRLDATTGSAPTTPTPKRTAGGAPDVISSVARKATAAPAKTSPLKDSWTAGDEYDSAASSSVWSTKDADGGVKADDAGYESEEDRPASRGEADMLA